MSDWLDLGHLFALYHFDLGIWIVRGDLLDHEGRMFAISYDVEVHLPIMEEELQRDLGMMEDKIRKRIPCTRLCEVVDRLIEDGHDTHLLLEVLLRLTFLIELGVSTWQCHSHIHESIRHEHLMRETDDTQTYPRDQDEQDDVEYIAPHVDKTLPE